MRFESFIGSNMTQQTEIKHLQELAQSEAQTLNASISYTCTIYTRITHTNSKKNNPNSTIILVHGHDENLHVLKPKMYSNSHITHVNLLLPKGVSHQS